MCLAGGHRLEGLECGHTTSGKGEGPRNSHTKLNGQGVIQRGEGKYYNPDPLYQLIGRVNEAKVKIDGHDVTGLIDLGANISIWESIHFKKLCRQIGCAIETIMAVVGNRRVWGG